MTLLAEIKTFFTETFKPRPAQAVLTPGIYHFEHEAEGGKSRVHLRVDADGSGLLIVNAARVFHLNPTAIYMAWLVLEKIDVVKAAGLIIVGGADKGSRLVVGPEKARAEPALS